MSNKVIGVTGIGQNSGGVLTKKDNPSVAIQTSRKSTDLPKTAQVTMSHGGGFATNSPDCSGELVKRIAQAKPNTQTAVENLREIKIVFENVKRMEKLYSSILSQQYQYSAPSSGQIDHVAMLKEGKPIEMTTIIKALNHTRRLQQDISDALYGCFPKDIDNLIDVYKQRCKAQRMTAGMVSI